MRRIYLVVLLFLFASSAFASGLLDEWEPKTSFDGRVGYVYFKNTSLYPVTVTLWHPDSKSMFKQWTVNGQDSISVEVGIGSDWGLQIGTGPVKTLNKVSTWDNNSWHSTPELFYKSNQNIVAKGTVSPTDTNNSTAQQIIDNGSRSTSQRDPLLESGLTVDVDQHIPEGKKAGKDDIAVVIGNKNYASGGAPDVDFAVRDASVMKEYLVRTMGFDSRNIIYAENATLSRFFGIFGSEGNHKGQLYKWVKPGISKVFIYYAGHGAPDLENGEAYFVPVDANTQLLRVQGYRVQTFYDNLTKLDAKSVIVVLDACFSGATPKGNLFKGTSALVRSDKIAVKPANIMLISSSSGEQVSSWYTEKRHGLFTYYFLKGLRGEADSDRNSTITAAEMRSYLNEHVPYMARRLTGNEQTPQVNGSDAAVLAELKP